MLVTYAMTTAGSRGLGKGALRSIVLSVSRENRSSEMQRHPSDILVLHWVGVWLRRGTRVVAETLR